jgi:hypothetical protein
VILIIVSTSCCWIQTKEGSDYEWKLIRLH